MSEAPAAEAPAAHPADLLLADANCISDTDRALIHDFLSGRGVNPDPLNPVKVIVIREEQTATHLESVVIELNYSNFQYRKVRRKRKS